MVSLSRQQQIMDLQETGVFPLSFSFTLVGVERALSGF